MLIHTQKLIRMAVIASLVAILGFASTAVAGLEGNTAKDAKAATMNKVGANKTLSKAEQDTAVALIRDGNNFRLYMGSKPAVALKRYLTGNALNKWNNEIQPIFEKMPMGMIDFFAQAIVWPAAIADHSGVVGYYNPWSDILFCASWKQLGKGWKVVDFIFMTGESLSKQQLDDKCIFPAWVRMGGAPGIALGTEYIDSMTAFYALCPTFRSKTFKFTQFADLVKEYGKELAFVYVRQKKRLEQLTEYFYNPNKNNKITAIRIKVNNLIRAIESGDINNLIKLKTKVDPVTKDNLMQLPVQIRKDFSEALYLSVGDKALVGLVPPRYPLWFVLAHFSHTQTNPSLEVVELQQFQVTGAMANVLNQIKEMKP